MKLVSQNSSTPNYSNEDVINNFDISLLSQTSPIYQNTDTINDLNYSKTNNNSNTTPQPFKMADDHSPNCNCGFHPNLSDTSSDGDSELDTDNDKNYQHEAQNNQKKRVILTPVNQRSPLFSREESSWEAKHSVSRE